MRVFIGIKASDETCEQILKWQVKHKDLPVRFIQSENLHLTLAPPWYENNIKKLLKNLNKFSFPKTFEITLNRISKGPPRNPRLIWIKGPKHQDLAKMQGEIAKFLKISKQKYSAPHVTIARFKMKEAILIPEINEEIELKFDVSEITLFESKLSPKGADYFELSSLKI